MNPRKIFYSQGHQTLEHDVCHPAFKNITVFECSGVFLCNFHKCLNRHCIQRETVYIYMYVDQMLLFFYFFCFLAMFFFFFTHTLNEKHFPISIYFGTFYGIFHSFYIFDVSAKPLRSRKSDRRMWN